MNTSDTTEEDGRTRPPLACYWVQEPDGTRWLVPGCVARLHNADADACTCPTLARQLAQARREPDQAQRGHRPRRHPDRRRRRRPARPLVAPERPAGPAGLRPRRHPQRRQDRLSPRRQTSERRP